MQLLQHHRMSREASEQHECSDDWARENDSQDRVFCSLRRCLYALKPSACGQCQRLHSKHEATQQPGKACRPPGTSMAFLRF
eukprot:scaffold41382_cov24-Prasinocladus_malaysianus.AAC.2